MQGVFDLIPTNGRKSFYGKAKVVLEDDGTQTLYSYNTKIMTKNLDGTLTRYYDYWSNTTGTHIKAFSGLNKKQFFELECLEC